MLTAAHHRAHAELPDCGLPGASQMRHPSKAAPSGRNIRFLHNLAQRAQIRETVRTAVPPM